MDIYQETYDLAFKLATEPVGALLIARQQPSDEYSERRETLVKLLQGEHDTIASRAILDCIETLKQQDNIAYLAGSLELLGILMDTTFSTSFDLTPNMRVFQQLGAYDNANNE